MPGPKYIDGDWGDEVEISEEPHITYPFKDYPTADVTVKQYRRKYRVTPKRFTPKIADRPSGIPHTDPSNAAAYLAFEGDLERDNDHTAVFERIFSTIPGTQTRIGSAPWTKPVFPSTDFNNYYITTIDPAATATIFSLSEAASSVGRFVSGGTFTVTYKTSTTGALAYNASNATIEAAIEALADAASDSLNISVNNQLSTEGHLTITWIGGGGGANFSNSNTSLNVGSLTPAATYQQGTSVGNPNGIHWVGRTTITISKTAHSISNGQEFRWDSVYTPSSGANSAIATVLDANTFTMPLAPNSPVGAFINPAYIRRLIRTYLPGSVIVPARDIEKFYLPSSIIGQPATASDIPIATVNASDNAFLLAICQGATWLTAGFDGPVSWLGPILKTTETQIYVA